MDPSHALCTLQLQIACDHFFFIEQQDVTVINQHSVQKICDFFSNKIVHRGGNHQTILTRKLTNKKTFDDTLFSSIL